MTDTTTTTFQPIPPRDRRIVRHIRAMQEAGTDIEKFVNVLHAFRDDGGLTAAQREAVFKTLAQDAMAAYVVMVTGQPLDLMKIIEEVDQLKATAEANKS